MILSQENPIAISRTREYRIWTNMKQRCNNPASDGYKWYGAKGIAVCREWSESFHAFLLDMGQCPPEYTIERKDRLGNYSPDNCVWASQAEQQLNKSNNLLLSHNGVTKTAKQWADEYGLPDYLVRQRIRRRLPGEKVLSNSDFRANYKKIRRGAAQ